MLPADVCRHFSKAPDTPASMVISRDFASRFAASARSIRELVRYSARLCQFQVELDVIRAKATAQQKLAILLLSAFVATFSHRAAESASAAYLYITIARGHFSWRMHRFCLMAGKFTSASIKRLALRCVSAGISPRLYYRRRQDSSNGIPIKRLRGNGAAAEYIPNRNLSGA